MNARTLRARLAASPTVAILALPFIAAAAIVLACAWALAILYATAREMLRATRPVPDSVPDSHTRSPTGFRPGPPATRSAAGLQTN